MDSWFHILKLYPYVHLRRVCKLFKDVIDLIARPMLARLRPALTAFFSQKPVPFEYLRTGGKRNMHTVSWHGGHKAWNNGEYTRVLRFILAEIARMDSVGAYAQFCHRYNCLICTCSHSYGDGTYSEFYGISHCEITSTTTNGIVHKWRFANRELPDLWNLNFRFTRHMLPKNLRE